MERSELEWLATRIIRYRGKHNISQSKFATLCKVNRYTILQIENLDASPSRLTVAKIEEVLNNKE